MKETTTTDGYTAYGFYKSSLHAPNFAAGFGEGKRPTGSEEISTSIGPVSYTHLDSKKFYHGNPEGKRFLFYF